jgi:hypothetical protein
LRQGELSRFQYKANLDFDLRCADQEVTAWGTMAMIKRMLDHLGLDAAWSQLGLPQPGSKRGYVPAQRITQLALGSLGPSPSMGSPWIWTAPSCNTRNRCAYSIPCRRYATSCSLDLNTAPQRATNPFSTWQWLCNSEPGCRDWEQAISFDLPATFASAQAP